MRILVTGAAGFLGRAFVRHHVAAGDEVWGIDNLSNPYSYWPAELPEHQRFEEDAETLDFIPGTGTHPIELAYHFAAPVGGRMKIEGDPMFNADSLRLDSLFFRWAIRNTKLAVYPSSSAVYPVDLQDGNGRPLYESDFNPRGALWSAPDQMYGFTKLTGEVLAWRAESYGLNTLCVRPFSGYGEGQSPEYPVPSILGRAKRHEDPLMVWGSGQQKRDFIHVDDLVGATIARLDAGVDGYQSMNIGSGIAVSFDDIALIGAMWAGYEPEIGHDASKPQGVDSRFCDPTLMNTFYWPQISLATGLSRVLESLLK